MHPENALHAYWLDTFGSSKHALMLCRFVQKQLIVEFNMNPTIASLLGWTINKHSIIGFALYVSGRHDVRL